MYGTLQDAASGLFLYLMFQAGVATAGDAIDPEELLQELVGSTGAWKSWSSQFLGSKAEKTPGMNQHQLLATLVQLMNLIRSSPH